MSDTTDAWILRTRRGPARRVLVAGALILLAGLALLSSSMDMIPDWHLAGVLRRTDQRVVGGAIAAIGACLIVAGIVMLARSSRPRPAGDGDDRAA